LPDPISEGELLTDSAKKTWRLGRSIGLGGFGEIYLASDELNKPVREDAQYVIKVERHSNGPLFVEKNFYIRTAQMDMINEWVAKRNMRALGMPHYLGTGSHHYDGEHYRFLVLPRFGLDVEKVFIRQGRKFHVKTAFTLASYIIDVLEYIHNHDYIHGDIKGSNLLLGLDCQSPVYLLDYGLATRYLYRDGRHKEYRHDERRAHDGTLEFTSRDAHIGAHSRRGDLEILGYNLVQWLCGRLPWEGNTDVEEVKAAKIAAMNNITSFLNNAFKPNHAPAALHYYLQYVANLGFETQPDYKYCKRLFRQAIREEGFQDDGKLTFHSHAKKTTKKRKILYEPENKGICVKKKCIQPSRQPCVIKNLNRITRNVASTLPLLRSKNEFNWAKVLASDPEKIVRKQCAALAHKTEQDTPARSDRSECLSPDSLDNPTPAMLAVLSRMRDRTQDDAMSTRSGKRSRSESRCPSPLEPNFNTPAMEEVLQRREKESQARPAKVGRRNSARLATPPSTSTRKLSPVAKRSTRNASLNHKG